MDISKALGFPVQSFMAIGSDNWRKPATDMWDFMIHHCNEVVTLIQQIRPCFLEFISISFSYDQSKRPYGWICSAHFTAVMLQAVQLTLKMDALRKTFLVVIANLHITSVFLCFFQCKSAYSPQSLCQGVWLTTQVCTLCSLSLSLTHTHTGVPFHTPEAYFLNLREAEFSWDGNFIKLLIIPLMFNSFVSNMSSQVCLPRYKSQRYSCKL